MWLVKINFQPTAINNNKSTVVGLIINGKIIWKMQKVVIIVFG